jgi:ATP-dependent DNA ligase
VGDFPIRPPLDPMLARLARDLPRDGFWYEPKWDGFRCVVFRACEKLDLRSRRQRPLARYFPELVAALLTLRARRFVLDGEILVTSRDGFDFAALLARLHPAASRVERLRRETPASLVAFDLVALEDDDLRRRAFRERRALLVELLEGARPPLFVTPLTDDAELAERWLERYRGGGIDGVVAKHPRQPYEAGARRMVKVKHERTADCVVGGFRWLVDRPLPSSLLLGLYEGDTLRHVGIASSFSEARRRQLLDEIRPHVAPLAGHPWEHGFLVSGSPVGRLRGAAGRWSPDEMEQDWTPLAPELVCEVTFDQLDDHRFRHPARFRRWRPDLDPRSCTLEQLDVAPFDVRELLPLR